MTTFTLEAQRERIAPENPFPTLEHTPLYHQWRTYQALERAHLVVNTYNTGTGKTVAALLHLFRLNGRRQNVLFIAPTNALIEQHVADIREFVRQNELDFLVAEVNAAQLRAMAATRSGETLYRLIREPQTYPEWFGLAPTEYRKSPLILVVNPDIFYYALYFRYHRHDQRNIFGQMVSAFSYVVIDEFHYYNSKQFANFLFYFLLTRQFGRFEGRGHRICLLSATPTEAVTTFLARTFGEQWAWIAPTNEPAEAEGLETIPTLTALEVTVVAEEMQTWVGGAHAELKEALEAGEHGAMISSALWRVNESHAALRRRLGAERLGRITGAEPEEKRKAATAQPLILATPTVDIGYNFKKYNKARQNIDFLACDARFTDELIQRIGRAGRVLGKEVTEQPSRATLLLPLERTEPFLVLDGQTLSRHAFAEWLNDESGLPAKHDLSGYIRSHAIMECFYPILNVRKNLPPTMQSEMDDLYAQICAVFAPKGSSLPLWKPQSFFRRYISRTRWLRDSKRGNVPVTKETAQMVADWLKWSHGDDYSPAALLPNLSMFVSNKQAVSDLRDFVKGQIVLTESLFSFRDSFQGPTAAIYDPDGLLSSERFNSYDLLHILANFDYELLDKKGFCQVGGDGSIKADCYLRLLGFREPKLTVELLYETSVDEKTWKEHFCRAPIALKGLQLRVRERGGDRVALASQLVTLFENKYLVAMIIPPSDEGALRGRLRGTTLYSRPLEVQFTAEGWSDNEYHILLGTAAWLAESELRGHFLWQARKESGPIIL